MVCACPLNAGGTAELTAGVSRRMRAVVRGSNVVKIHRLQRRENEYLPRCDLRLQAPADQRVEGDSRHRSAQRRRHEFAVGGDLGIARVNDGAEPQFADADQDERDGVGDLAAQIPGFEGGGDDAHHHRQRIGEVDVNQAAAAHRRQGGAGDEAPWPDAAKAAVLFVAFFRWWRRRRHLTALSLTLSSRPGDGAVAAVVLGVIERLVGVIDERLASLPSSG